jgi:hypothetical protein
MSHCNTIFHQLLQIFSRHEFDSLAREHHVGQKFRSFNRWSQFGALFMGQLTGRRSLRDIVTNLAAQGRKFYHLGFANISRARAQNLIVNLVFVGSPYENTRLSLYFYTLLEMG